MLYSSRSVEKNLILTIYYAGKFDAILERMRQVMSQQETSEPKSLEKQPRSQNGFVKKVWEKIAKKKRVVAVVPLHGVIAQGGMAPGGRSGSLSAIGLEEQLKTAFEMKNLECVALLVNSPGGSPVQSASIAARIRELAQEHKVEVLTFCEDVAASGGYWLACAGDKIYADKATIVGSIGVISASFGFEKLIEKIGMERRIIISGDNKRRLDPFMPLKDEDIKHIKGIQKDIHQYFIDYVQERRGSVLNGATKKLFSGDFWCGDEALKLGLIDEIGHLHGVCRAKYGKDVTFRVVKGKQSFIRGLISSKYSGGPLLSSDSLVDALLDKTYAQSLWGRFGL